MGETFPAPRTLWQLPSVLPYTTTLLWYSRKNKIIYRSPQLCLLCCPKVEDPFFPPEEWIRFKDWGVPVTRWSNTCLVFPTPIQHPFKAWQSLGRNQWWKPKLLHLYSYSNMRWFAFIKRPAGSSIYSRPHLLWSTLPGIIHQGMCECTRGCVYVVVGARFPLELTNWRIQASLQNSFPAFHH